MKLTDAFISAAARCAPPGNKPSLKELKNCEPFLDEEYELLSDKQVLLALGKIAFESILKLLQRNNIELPKPKPKFEHGAIYHLGSFSILVSYHPSRQNTNTGLLTPQMWDAIFSKAKSLIGEVTIPG